MPACSGTMKDENREIAFASAFAPRGYPMVSEWQALYFPSSDNMGDIQFLKYVIISRFPIIEQSFLIVKPE